MAVMQILNVSYSVASDILNQFYFKLTTDPTLSWSCCVFRLSGLCLRVQRFLLYLPVPYSSR